MIATIPMTAEVAELIGTAAERVDNRSLLLDKFVFHKRWPLATDDHDREVKWDEASRWSFMRIASGASKILNREAQERRRKASGRNVEPKNKARFEAEAKIAETLATVAWDMSELQQLRARHTRRFLSLFRTGFGDRASITIGQLEGRLAINLADSLIQNAGICVDRLFGLPFIPGSAVKGVCRHTALAELRTASPEAQPALLQTFCAVFGTADNDFESGDLRAFRGRTDIKDADCKGAVSFLTAYPVNEAQIVVDLTNVHYPDYYRSGHPEDQAKERPQPNPFPTVEVGAQFAFCLVLNGLNNNPDLLRSATRWLASALTESGVGGKTASGYGWFSLQPRILSDLEGAEEKEREAAEAAARAAAEAEARKQAETARQASLSPEARAAESLLALPDEAFAVFAKTLAEKSEIEQRALINLLTSNKEKRTRWKMWKKKKPDIANSVEAVRTKLNLPPLP